MDHWLDMPAPADPEPASQNALPNWFGKEMGAETWTPPPAKTPGQIYAAYGDTGAMSGETEGLSPAMKQMVRRNLGRRLSEQTMGERQQTAEQAMRGAGFVAPNPLLAAATTGATSRFMGDTPQETAGRVATSLLPVAGGRAVQAGLQYAPRMTAAALTAGASLLPQSTETEAADTNPNPYKWDEDAYQKRRKAIEKTGNPKTIREFEAREGTARAETLKNAADWQAAQEAKATAADALSQYKQAVEPAARVLKPEIQSQIQNATSQEEASRIYNDSMRDYIKANQTFAERDPDLMHAIQLGTAALGGLGAGKLAAGRAGKLAQATKETEDAYRAAYGSGASDVTQGSLNELAMKQATLERLSKLSPYDVREMAVGTALPWATGTALPATIDIAESQPGSERNRKAWASLADIGNMGRGAIEGLSGTILGQFGGGLRRDFGGTQERARAVLGAIGKTPPVAPGTVVYPGSRPPPPQSSPPQGQAPMSTTPVEPPPISAPVENIPGPQVRKPLEPGMAVLTDKGPLYGGAANTRWQSNPKSPRSDKKNGGRSFGRLAP